MTPLIALDGARSISDVRPLIGLTLGVAAVLLLSGGVIAILHAMKCLDPRLQRELWLRWKSWLGVAAAMLVPVLLGGVWLAGAVLLLGLLCYREYARVTGIAGEHLLMVLVQVGIAALTLASWCGIERSFLALATMLLLVGVPILGDRPAGYLRRVGLAVLGLLLFGVSLGSLACLAASVSARLVLLLILLAVALNDVFAFCVGKLVGGPRLLPRTSPGKTVAGAVGALVLTTLLVGSLAHGIAPGMVLTRPVRLAGLGVLISVLGQLGDLVFSAIKRDLGIKDMGQVLPGHGGWLDRFDSLVLIPVPVFYYLSHHLEALGTDLALHIGSGG
jgi:phosphatidate cytidylyltransferase